jgi:hypothetical protein
MVAPTAGIRDLFGVFAAPQNADLPPSSARCGDVAVDDSLVTATYWGPVLGAVVGIILGWIIAIFSEPARAWLYGPKLSLDFRPSDGRCIADSRDCRWARVSVMNYGRRYLRQCQPIITNIEQEQGGEWVQTEPPFIDPLIPEWSVMKEQEKYRSRDLPRKIEFFVNILAAEDSKSGNDKLLLSVEDWPGRIRNTFIPGHRYRITVTVTGDQVKPKDIRMIVNWTGNWRFDTATDSPPRRRRTRR